MSDVMLYDVLGNDWRWGQDDHGVYAVAADVAKTFEYRDSSDALRLLDHDEVGTQNVRVNLSDGRSQVRALSVIYEDGIWELVFRSTKPEAKAIKKRVKQILREIRQDGIYIQDSMPEALRVRADEKFSYSKLKDFVMYASDIKAVRPVNMELLGKTRKDGKPYAADAKVAKNYLATEELSDINNAALAALGMLGLRMRSFKNGYTMQDVRMSLLKVLDSI